MNVIIGYAVIYGLGAFAAGFAISELWRMDRPAKLQTEQYPSGRCTCGLSFDDCNDPIIHGIRR
jgi:hypothetical protein